jgi:hypothetical protein
MNFNISVQAVDADEVIVSGSGDQRVLNYLSNVGVEALEALDETAEVTVGITQGTTKVLSFTGDADTAATVLKGKVTKLRRAAAAASNAPAE